MFFCDLGKEQVVSIVIIFKVIGTKGRRGNPLNKVPDIIHTWMVSGALFRKIQNSGCEKYFTVI